jgi:hypothetical protein
MSAMPRTYRSTEEHRESFDDGALRRCVRDHSSLSRGHRHVDTSRCALDLDASSFAFLSFLSFTTPLVTTSTSTSGRHGRRRRRGRPRIETREGADRVFAANGRSVIHSVGEGAKRKRIEANARRWLDDSNARRSRSIVAVAWRWKRLLISSAVARVVRTSSPTRLATSRRSPTNVPRGTLHVTRVITRGCLLTSTFASHNS